LRLTDDQLRAWDRDGFLAIERLIDASAAETLRGAYDEILERRFVEGGGMLGASRAS